MFLSPTTMKQNSSIIIIFFISFVYGTDYTLYITNVFENSTCHKLWLNMICAFVPECILKKARSSFCWCPAWSDRLWGWQFVQCSIKTLLFMRLWLDLETIYIFYLSEDKPNKFCLKRGTLPGNILRILLWICVMWSSLDNMQMQSGKLVNWRPSKTLSQSQFGMEG